MVAHTYFSAGYILDERISLTYSIYSVDSTDFSLVYFHK